MVNTDQLAPHVSDISRVLGEKADKKEIERMLTNYIEVYKVSLDEAKRSIVRHFGGEPGGLAVGPMKKIADLKGPENNVDLLVRVVFVQSKDVKVKGEAKTIHAGILGDDTGTIPFTAWTDEFPFEKGDVISVRNAYTKDGLRSVEVNMGDRCRVLKEEKDALPAFRGPVSEAKVVDFREGMSRVAVMARILGIEKREVEVDGLKKTVFSGTMADETGKCSFSAWHDFELKAGDVVRIEGGYIKSWRGIPQFSFDDRAVLEKVPSDKMPSADELMEKASMMIETVNARGGAFDTTIVGVILDVKPGSGLIQRCPECNRVVQKGACRVHGKVDGKWDLRIKAVIDDGTGAMTVVFNRELTETFISMDMDACIAMAQKAANMDIIADKIRDVLLAKTVTTTGNITSDDFGLMMIARTGKVAELDVVKEAKALIEEMEGS